MANVYVASKSCGCIVAAFPINIDKAIKGDLLKTFAKAGYDVDQATEYDVKTRFNLSCDCNKPPLLKIADDAAAGVDKEDVDAAATEDLTPDGCADDLLDETAVSSAGEESDQPTEETEEATEEVEAPVEEEIPA